MATEKTLAQPVQHRLPMTFDPDRLLDDLMALRDHQRQPQPGPYHNGEWTGISLHSAGGQPGAAPSFPSLKEYTFTPAIDRTPYFKEILSSLPFRLQVVRILSLPPGGRIGEHFDFFSNFQFGLVRLHVPIVTHPDVEFLIEGERCRWREGEFWYGDFSKPHSVSNGSDVTRVHLVIDSEINEPFLSMLPAAYVAEQAKKGITLASPEHKVQEEELRRYECRFDIPGTIMPFLVLGRLEDLIKGSSAQVVCVESRLLVLIDGVERFFLRSLGEGRFGFVGLSDGCFLEFEVREDRVAGISFVIRGVQRDLVRARLGIAKGEPVAEQRVPLRVCEG
jgi:hypothetical protein